MAQQAKTPLTQPGNLSLIPRIHLIEGERTNSPKLSSDPNVHSVPSPPSKKLNVKNKTPNRPSIMIQPTCKYPKQPFKGLL